MSGFLLINKPKEWTSHDVVGYLRKVTRIKKIGHAGTLDPFATGLLIVGVGRDATKRLDEFKGMKKTYIATLRLGAVSDTFDSTGVITPCHSERSENSNEVEESLNRVLQTFIGEQEQIPPMHSAKKVGGKKLYELARKGIEVERKPSIITIYDIKLLDVDLSPCPGGVGGGIVKIEVQCSTGTYIRTLAHDIGQKLGVGAYCEELERTQIGDLYLKDAIGVKDISRDDWQTHLHIIEKTRS